jgi:hypothetical protein
MTDPFEELEAVIDAVADQTDAEIAKKEKRDRAKYYIVDVKHLCLTQKELREYMEQHYDDISTKKVIKGFELEPKKKVVIAF